MPVLFIVVFSRLFEKKNIFFSTLHVILGITVLFPGSLRYKEGGGGGVKDFFTIAKRHFFQLFSVLAALNFLNNYNFEYSGRRLYHYNEDDF